MSYGFPPALNQLIQQQMATGHYDSEDELLIDAIRALAEVSSRHVQLRTEIQSRLSKAGKEDSEPLDLEAFKEEARRRLTEEE